jgi:pyruvate dehydrogenase E2 component (dihydrolipoamide acetyltransferase)
MNDELRLPELGENIREVDVSAVLVAVGDRIRRDQPVIEVETEKASLEVPASADGRVAELLVRAGDTIKVGQVILVIEADVGAGEKRAATGPAAGAGAQAPDAAPSAAERAAEAPATPSAIPEALPAPRPAPVIAFPAARPGIGEAVPAAPSVRALARELGIDIRRVPGTGTGGRISRDDVKAHAKRLIQDAGRPGPAVPELPDFSKWGGVRRERMSRVRRATASSMSVAWSAIPHVAQFDSADVTALEAERKEHNRGLEPGQAKLTPTAIAIARVAKLLVELPQFNASVDAVAGEIVYKEYVNVGVAVDTDRGLLVPVVRDADAKPASRIAAELADLAARAREKKIRPEELAGATFTVSNLGGLGTTWFAPIVNWPEVAILGLGRAEDRARLVDGAFVPRRILPLSLSYDHRAIDGADAARFLRRVAEALERPLSSGAETGAER